MTGPGYTLVYILGSGRCGSTLLDLLLGGHPDILALGELSTLNTAFHPLDPPAADGLVARSAEAYVAFWGAVKERYEEGTGQAFEDARLNAPRWKEVARMSRPEVNRWARRNELILEAAHALSGRPILTDASKRAHRLFLLHRSGRFELKVIHLVRDGRAVANSYLHRYDSFGAGLRTWTTTALAASLLRRRFYQRDWLRVRYEDLAADPEATLRWVCAFLGVRFVPQMLAYRSHPSFGVGGNPLVKEGGSEAIRLDERWRQQLNAGHRLLFGLAAGWLNRLYGYRAFR